MRTRFMPALAIPAVLALALTACGGSDADTEAGGDAGEGGIELINEGQLTVCTHLSYQPFQFEDGGDIVGFDVDLADLIADELGVEQTIENAPFDTITTGAVFSSGQCDLAAAGMTITPERADVIDFSEGYFDANQAILATDDSGITDEASLAGKPVAVQTGTTGLMHAEENLTDAELIIYEDLPLSLQAIQNGEVEAVVNDNGVLYDFARDNDGFTVVENIDTGEEYGMAVAKGNEALLEVVDQVLTDAKDDGTYAEIYEKWFGAQPEE